MLLRGARRASALSWRALCFLQRFCLLVDFLETTRAIAKSSLWRLIREINAMPSCRQRAKDSVRSSFYLRAVRPSEDIDDLGNSMDAALETEELRCAGSSPGVDLCGLNLQPCGHERGWTARWSEHPPRQSAPSSSLRPTACCWPTQTPGDRQTFSGQCKRQPPLP